MTGAMLSATSNKNFDSKVNNATDIVNDDNSNYNDDYNDHISNKIDFDNSEDKDDKYIEFNFNEASNEDYR